MEEAKTVRASMLAAILLLAPLPHALAFIDPATCTPGGLSISATQPSLSPTTLLTCPHDPGHDYITRTYAITNGTATPWTDYHFDVVLTGFEETDPTGFAWDTQHPHGFTLGTVEFDGTNVSVFFDQALASSAAFNIALRFGAFVDGTATVTGTPSVPEPGVLALLGLALAGLAATGKRRR